MKNFETVSDILIVLKQGIILLLADPVNIVSPYIYFLSIKKIMLRGRSPLLFRGKAVSEEFGINTAT